jgi:hypothetical protein
LHDLKESVVQAACIRVAKQHGWRGFKWVSPSRRGVPDMIFIKGPPLQIIFVEFKQVGQHPTPLQKFVHGLLRDCGAQVEVVSDVEHARRIFA